MLQQLVQTVHGIVLGTHLLHEFRGALVQQPDAFGLMVDNADEFWNQGCSSDDALACCWRF